MENMAAQMLNDIVGLCMDEDSSKASILAIAEAAYAEVLKTDRAGAVGESMAQGEADEKAGKEVIVMACCGGKKKGCKGGKGSCGGKKGK